MSSLAKPAKARHRQGMLLKAYVIFGWMAAALVAGADETLPRLKVGSEVYSNVTVTSVTATDIYFNSAQGFGNAKLKNLDPELQQHFHFNPATADETEKQQLEANTQYRTAVAASKPVPVEPPPADSPARPESGNPDDIIVPKLYARSFLHQPAPQFVAEKWLTPPPELAGKFVLVDFWATKSSRSRMGTWTMPRCPTSRCWSMRGFKFPTIPDSLPISAAAARAGSAAVINSDSITIGGTRMTGWNPRWSLRTRPSAGSVTKSMSRWANAWLTIISAPRIRNGRRTPRPVLPAIT